MQPIFKTDLSEILARDGRLDIELGCGRFKTPGRIGIDQVDLDQVDIVADLTEGLPFIPDNTVDAVYTNHFLEHIENLDFLLAEICRVLKPNGVSCNYVPHFSNPHYYSDWTHRTFFGLYTLDYFGSQDRRMRRRVPVYYSSARLRVQSRRLIFQSYFKPVHYLKKTVQAVVNACPLFQELWEENLCWICPCHGVEVLFGPLGESEEA